MPDPVRALLVGWFGERNLGDEAMLEGLLALLERAAGPIRATVVTADPDATARQYGVATLKRAQPAQSGFRNLELVRAVAASRLVTLGGGDLIRESPTGPNAAHDWLQRIRVPLRLRKPVALVGVSVGELHRPGTLAEIRDVLPRLALVAGRDAASVERLRELGAPNPLRMGDLALEAPALQSLPGREGDHREPTKQPVIGVSVRELVDRGASVGGDAGERLQRELAAALDRVVERTGARIELIPFRTRRRPNQQDDDARVGESLAAQARTGPAWIRQPRPESVADFVDVARGFDLVVGMRLHAAILGAAVGLPVVGIAYDPKVTGFLGDIGAPEQALPLDADADAIAAAIERTLADGALPGRIGTGVAAARVSTRALEPHLARLAGRSV